MHTVPAGYLRAFADTSAPRRNPHLWRFERATAQAKLISVRDASVRRDIYTLRTEDGEADTTIETELLSSAVEDSFPPVVQLLMSGGTPTYWQWRDVSRFMAFQLARTPRMFQIVKDEGSRQGLGIGPNDPQLGMVHQAPFLEKWLCGMTWILCWNRSTLPLLTSDNPVVMWADRREGAELGVGFQEPALRILFPLTPKICLTAVQTGASLKAVLEELPESKPEFSDFYPLRVDSGSLGIDQAVMLNQVAVSNAERYVYANSDDEKVQLFLNDFFFGLPGPVRRFDRKPIGSPVDPKEASDRGRRPLETMRLDPLKPADPVEMTPKDFELQVHGWLARGAERVENCQVIHQDKVAGAGGQYAIDVVVRLTLFSGAQLIVLAECKHQGRPVARDEILALEAKLRDVAAHKGMLFSTSGFQEGAIKLAQARGIATITVIDGQWLYETKALHRPPIVPPWVKLPRFAGQMLTPLENGYSCQTIDDEDVDAIQDFLDTTN